MPESSLSQQEIEGLVVAFVALILLNGVFLFAASSGALAGDDALGPSDMPGWAEQDLVDVVPDIEKPRQGAAPSASGAFGWDGLSAWGDTSAVPPPQSEERYGDVRMNGNAYDVILINVTTPYSTYDTDTAMGFVFDYEDSFEEGEDSGYIDDEYRNDWMGEQVQIVDVEEIQDNELIVTDEIELLIAGSVEDSVNLSAGQTATMSATLETAQSNEGAVTFETEVTRTDDGEIVYSYETYDVQYIGQDKAIYGIFPADHTGYTVVGESKFTIDATGDSSAGDLQWEVNEDDGGGFLGGIVDGIFYLGASIVWAVALLGAVVSKGFLFLAEAVIFILGVGVFILKGWAAVWTMTSGVHPIIGLLTLTPLIVLFAYTFNGTMKLIKAMPFT